MKFAFFSSSFKVSRGFRWPSVLARKYCPKFKDKLGKQTRETQQLDHGNNKDQGETEMIYTYQITRGEITVKMHSCT